MEKWNKKLHFLTCTLPPAVTQRPFDSTLIHLNFVLTLRTSGKCSLQNGDTEHLPRPLTLLVSLREGVEQHLERGWVAEAGQNLHGGGVGQETFTPVHCLSCKGGRRHTTGQISGSWSAPVTGDWRRELQIPSSGRQ